MKNDFNLDELEEFLQDSAEQHRMYPSDKVWRNIDKELHGNRKWPALSFGAILTGSIITAGLILIHPDKSLLSTKLPEFGITEKQLIFTPAELQPNSVKTLNNLKEENAARNKVISNKIIISESSVATGKLSGTPLISSMGDLQQTLNKHENELTLSQIAGIENNATAPDLLPANGGIAVAVPVPNAGEAIEYDQQDKSFSGRNFAAKATNLNTKTIQAANLRINEEAANNAVAFQAKFSFKQNRWSSFFYITPSASYRYLAESKVVDLHMQNGPIDPSYSHGVNSFVRHRQIAGLEVGGGLMYQISPNVRVRMGLQANTRGYSIDAYSSGTQVSAIVLNRGYYTDSVLAVSNINNFSGYQAINIQNRYFELSAPLSVDLKIGGKKRLELYVGAGLQPTYQFNKSMYLVSNDYKNYVQDASIARHFNVNTSLEAFLSYKAGKFTWQLGPQLRYQMLSGTNKAYPVHEHLIDYGIKIGVVKSFK
jgi:hypothetical protein